MAGAVRATDNFNRADSADLGANWDVATGEDNAEIFSDTARPSTLTTVTAVERYVAVAFRDNQFSEILIHTLAGGGLNVTGALVRIAAAAESNYSGEAAIGAVANSTIRKVVTGSSTLLASNSTGYVAGDIVRTEIIGTGLAQYKNGILNLTATDTDLSTGRPGINIYSDTNLSDARIDSWLGGDFPIDFSDLFPKQKMRNAIARGFGYA